MDFSWILKINDVENHIKKIVEKDENISALFDVLINYNGVETFVKIYELWKKTDIRFPFKHIQELKKIYVLQNPGKGVLMLSQLLDIDTSTIYSWKRDIKNGGRKASSKKKEIFSDLLD